MSLIKGSCHMLIRPSFVNNLVTTEATNQPYDEDTQMFNIHNSPAYRAQEIGLKQVVGEDGTVHNIEASPGSGQHLESCDIGLGMTPTSGKSNIGLAVT